MISNEQRATIRRLFYGEHWKVGTIAAQLNLHENTVKAAVNIDQFVARGQARPSALDPFVPLMRDILKQYPRLTGTRLHEMLRARGYLGSAIQVRRKIVQLDLRPHKTEAFLRLDTLPGEQGQIDWADFGMLRVGTGQRRLYGFILVLSWSRALWAHFSFDQTMSAVVRGHVACFGALGGVPRNILYDNMKTVVLDRDGDAIRFHPRFIEVKSYYLFNARPCPPRRPNEKGRVERSIRYLRNSFFAGRHFSDLEDVRAQFETWRNEVAHARKCPQDKTITIAEALEMERPRLLSLPDSPLESCDVRAVVARKQPYVTFDTNRYSIPHHYVGVPVTAVASEEEVRVVYGEEEIARHYRCWLKNQTIEDPHHIKALVDHKQRGRELKGRELVLAQIPQAEALYEKLMDMHERTQPHTTKLLELIESFGVEPVRQAVERAVERGTPRADSVAFLVEKAHTKTPGRLLPRPKFERREVDELHVKNHILEDYDELSKPNQ